MATAEMIREATVMKGVSWHLYSGTRKTPENCHVRMTYHDGTLFLMSPEYLHETGAERLSTIVKEVADTFAIDYACTRTTTLGRTSPEGGNAKEPDAAFYLGANEALVRDQTRIDLDAPPPPDLAIEVDHKSDSAVALPTYAALGVPEVWRFDARKRTLIFLHLAEGSYLAIDRSLALPMLTPAPVLHALDAFTPGMTERVWVRQVRAWAGGLRGEN